MRTDAIHRADGGGEEATADGLTVVTSFDNGEKEHRDALSPNFTSPISRSAASGARKGIGNTSSKAAARTPAHVGPQEDA